MKQKILLLASLLALLSACTPQADSQPTPLPPDFLPTAVALTAQSILATSDAMTRSVPPTETSTPTETPLPSTPLPSATPTFAAGFTDFAGIRFIAPGPMSSVTSPLKLQAIILSGRSGIVQIDLLGEDGRVLQRGLERVERVSGGNYRSFEMEFEIRAVSEKGYIRISSKDDHRRIETLNTMPVLLYSVGDTLINPIGNFLYERVMFDGLEDGDDVFGGVVNLKGKIWPFNDSPVFLELLTEDGTPLTSRVLDFNGTETQDFETTLPYKITEPTLVRLTVRQDNPELTVLDAQLGRLIYVYTQELLLHP